MNRMELLTTLLVSIGYRLPIIIALGVSLLMVLYTPRGRARTVTLAGLAILLVCTLGGGALSALPLLLIAQDNYSSLSGLNTLLSAAHIGLSLLEAAGFVLLAWGVSQALRQAPSAGKP